jgi:hypothetical protein
MDSILQKGRTGMLHLSLIYTGSPNRVYEIRRVKSCNDSGKAEIKFKTPKTASEKFLDFDPRDDHIKIKRNEKTVFKMTLLGKVESK